MIRELLAPALIGLIAGVLASLLGIWIRKSMERNKRNNHKGDYDA